VFIVYKDIAIAELFYFIYYINVYYEYGQDEN